MILDEDGMVFIDVMAQRVAAFATLATTLADIEDEEVKQLGLEMLQRIIESCTIPKAPAASLSVVK